MNARQLRAAQRAIKAIDAKPRRTPMQVTIEMLLLAHGQLEHFNQSECFHVRIENEPYMPFVIERQGNRVMIAHYRYENGDAIMDPEMVFDYDTWECLEIEQPAVYIRSIRGGAGRVIGGRRCKYTTIDGKQYVDRNFDRHVGELIRVWARNLREQDFQNGTAKSGTH